MTSFKLTPSFGGFQISTPGATTIAVADTPVKCAGTTTEMGASTEVDAGDATDNRLLYEGATAKAFKIDAMLTLAAASGTDQELEASIYHYDASAASGAVVAGSKVSGIAAATDGICVATSAIVTLDTGDYVEIHVANVTGTPNVTAEHGVLTAMGVEA